MQQQLSQATIMIKQIYDNGEKPSKIIDTGGHNWKIWPDVLAQLNLKTNTVYEIRYKAGEYNGKPDNVIKSAVAQAAAQSNGQTQEFSRARTNPVDSDRMGTMGMVNAFISIGAVAADAEAIGNLIKKCRDGLHRGWAD